MKTKLDIAIEDITPAMAEKILNDTTTLIEQGKLINRNISERRVDYYTDAMRAKQWQLTHQGIAFDDRGYLIDGQHRLWAVVRSGMTVPMVVTRGVPSSNCGLAKPLDLIDQGFTRTIAHSLVISHGYDGPSARVFSACVNYICNAIDRSDVRRRTVPVTLAILSIYEPHLRAIKALSPQGTKMTASVMAFSALVRASHKKEAEEFALGVYSEEGLQKGDPALALSKYFRSRMRGRRDTHHFAKVVANCLYCQIKGIKMDKIHPSGEALEWLLEQQPENVKKVLKILHP